MLPSTGTSAVTRTSHSGPLGHPWDGVNARECLRLAQGCDER